AMSTPMPRPAPVMNQTFASVTSFSFSRRCEREPRPRRRVLVTLAPILQGNLERKKALLKDAPSGHPSSRAAPTHHVRHALGPQGAGSGLGFMVEHLRQLLDAPTSCPR